MKLPWQSSADLLAGDSAVTLAETGWLLEKLRAANRSQVSEGLEERIQARLQAHSRAISTRQRPHVDWSRRWVQAGLAASLACVFGGGLLVTHYAALATGAIAGQQWSKVAPAPIVASAPTQGSSLAPAAARRRPASPVSVGRRKGRARSVAADATR